MTPKALARAVATLFTAAGRNYGSVELEVYFQTLSGVDDEEGLAAVEDVVAAVDLGQRAPSPMLVLDAVRAIRRRRSLAQPALVESTGPALSKSENLERVRMLRERLKT